MSRSLYGECVTLTVRIRSVPCLRIRLYFFVKALSKLVCKQSKQND